MKRVLIIGLSNIGDTLLMSPVVSLVHEAFPDAHVTLVVGERGKVVFADDPRIQVLVDADQFRDGAGRVRLAWALWRYRPHLIVDLRHTLYPLLLAPWRAWRYLRQPPRTMRHMRDRHLWKLQVQVPEFRRAMIRGCDKGPVTSDKARPSVLPGHLSLDTCHSPLWFSQKDVSQVEQLRRRWGLEPSSRFIVICPGARSHIKRWTADGFAQVADRLMTETSSQVIFSGEPEEKPLIEEIRALMTQKTHSVVGLVTIRQLGVLMQSATLVITNDSASLHVASTMNVPTLALFGPTDEEKYGPTAAHRRTLRRHLFCTPCEEALCRFSHECMRFISADEVYAAAIELLDTKNE